MNTITLTAPSHWAPYLINGDTSGLEPAEIDACNAWCKAEGVHNYACVACEDAGFRWHHDATYGQYALAADCQTYTFISD